MYKFFIFFICPEVNAVGYDEDSSGNYVVIEYSIYNENKEVIDSILEMLQYKKDKILIRERVVYYKNNVTFEIDNYSSPEVMYVVGIEGEKDLVDKTYLDLKKKINNIVNE